MIKRFAYAHFLSESYIKYKRCFQPVCGKMNNHKLIGIVYAMQKIKISEFERMTSATNSVKGNESKAMNQKQCVKSNESKAKS